MVEPHQDGSLHMHQVNIRLQVEAHRTSLAGLSHPGDTGWERREARNGQEWPGAGRSGQDWQGLNRSGQEWSGVARSGQEWSGVAMSGQEWP